MIKRLTTTLAYITFPLMFILMLSAKSVFVLLYSEKWLESVPYFQVLCLAGLALCLQSVNNQSIAAIGKSKTMFVYTILKRLVGILFIVLGFLFFGMKGLLVGMVLNVWFSYFVNIGLVSKYIGYKWYRQLQSLVPIILLSSLIALTCYIIGEYLQLSLYVDGGLKILLYVVLYMFFSVLLKLDAYQYTKATIMPLLKKIKK